MNTPQTQRVLDLWDAGYSTGHAAILVGMDNRNARRVIQSHRTEEQVAARDLAVAKKKPSDGVAIGRCPGCGAKVVMPCLKCRVDGMDRVTRTEKSNSSDGLERLTIDEIWQRTAAKRAKKEQAAMATSNVRVRNRFYEGVRTPSQWNLSRWE